MSLAQITCEYSAVYHVIANRLPIWVGNDCPIGENGRIIGRSSRAQHCLATYVVENENQVVIRQSCFGRMITRELDGCQPFFLHLSCLKIEDKHQVKYSESTHLIITRCAGLNVLE